MKPYFRNELLAARLILMDVRLDLGLDVSRGRVLHQDKGSCIRRSSDEKLSDGANITIGCHHEGATPRGTPRRCRGGRDDITGGLIIFNLRSAVEIDILT